MNILLIGGTGFMGKALAAWFSRRGNNVVTVGRSSINAVPGIKHFNVAASGWDYIVEALKGEEWTAVDLAYASIPNTSFVDPIKDFSDNLYLVNHHLQFMEKL